MKQHSRRSMRLSGYDYSDAGGYFITICTQNRRSVFGEIREGIMRINAYGQVVANCWDVIPQHYPLVTMDIFVIMPNHIHGILLLRDDEETIPTYRAPKFSKPVAGSVSTIISTFKAAVTRETNRYRNKRSLSPVIVWQRGFYDRIIRDESELEATRRYIIENPSNWELDNEFCE